MSSSVIDLALTRRECSENTPLSVSRSAFYIEGRGEPFFAWMHRPLEDRCLDHGVIICGPVGYEQLHSHRSLRHFADHLARESVPTLRFDWHGTGDSPGIDEDPERYATWLANIQEAADWLRTRFGCRQISVVGLRLGATLAAMSAAECSVDNLILWSPVVKGRTFVRELNVLSLTSKVTARAGASPTNDIEAGGFVLSSETADTLSAVDLMKCHPQCKRVLVVSRADLSEDDRLANQWAGFGVHVQQISVAGYAEMMAEPHRCHVPHEAIQQISDWLTSRIKVDARMIEPSDDFATRPAQPDHARRRRIQNRNAVCALTRSVVTQHAVATSSIPKEVGKIRESTFEISESPNLFGIVTEPARLPAEELPTIVLLNAGSAHRIAPSRLNVLLARQLAVHGFRCVRMDFCGLGDSILSQDEMDTENDPYTATAFRDIDLTMTRVTEQFRSKRIVLMGLCSGAYAAFQSAAQIENAALVESVLINPLTYFWKEGMTLEASPTKQLMHFHYYRSVALDPKRWLKLLSGKSKVGIGGAFRIVARRLGLGKPSTNHAVSPKLDSRKPTGLSHPAKEDLRGDLSRITQANRHLSMFFSKTDPGFSILNHYAKLKGRELQAKGQLTINFIDEADHTFSLRPARMELVEMITDYLAKRYVKNDHSDLAEFSATSGSL